MPATPTGPTGAAARAVLLHALRMMPNEAFEWLLLRLATPGTDDWAPPRIWPDAIGGFTDESRASIAEVRRAADELVMQRRKPI